MVKKRDGCVKPVAGPIAASTTESSKQETSHPEVVKVKARVGREAPDFEANAYVINEGFKPVKLSDYKGKWIVLCFYPGDFTFV